MMIDKHTVSRRTALVGAAGATAIAFAGSASASPRETEFAALERQYDRTLGVWAVNLSTGRSLSHRPDERFPILSVFKALLAAAILRDFPPRTLQRRLTWSRDDLVVNSPVTEACLRNGLTVAQLCEATVTRSDNTAANVLMRLADGPSTVTRFARSLGDNVTRLDRWEPELNSAIPGDPRDTTSPRAIGRDVQQLLTGRALSSSDRSVLTTWMLANQTAGARFGAGLPADWRLADKTGTGDYGTCNEAGVAWTGSGHPMVIVALTRGDRPDQVSLNEPLAAVAEVVARRLG